jgi:hypothetical protein
MPGPFQYLEPPMHVTAPPLVIARKGRVRAGPLSASQVRGPRQEHLYGVRQLWQGPVLRWTPSCDLWGLLLDEGSVLR